jgi:3-hydroxyisobutyrate dehydrogenase-like beta-hydroxyacid dehydrogenase
MTVYPRIAIIGQNETGSRSADVLTRAGASVIRIDPASKSPAGSLEEAVSGADVVLALGSSGGPSRIAERVIPLLGEDALYADLNAGTPATKRHLAALFPDGSFVDVAVVQQDSVPTEELVMDVAGTGAGRLIELFEPFGFTLRYVSEVPGEATARQLIRSLLAKGVAGAVIDCLWAAESMGLQSWAYQEILEEFEASSAETARQYLSGTAQHVKRRQIEMMDVVSMLNETGYESTMLPGIEFNYGRILHGKKIPFSKRP